MPRLASTLPSGFTILIIDDDEAVLYSTKQLLLREGHHVLIARNGQEALHLCQKHEIHLLLLDYSMPGMTGLDVIENLRSFNRETQIILQTGFTEKPPRQMLKELDIQGYHDKSDDPERLLLWVDAVIKNVNHTRVNQQLEHSLLVLGIALESRDLETAGHTERVVSLSQALAQKLQLDTYQSRALRQGAYLHDLGKLMIADRILHKAGALDADEWITMQSHSEKGFALALRIHGLAEPALEIIRHHHEAWDGSGYPDNLQGERIPFLARIFSLCDVFDALTSDRPYKAAWTVDAALSQLKKQAGKQFDPQLVPVFIDLISQTILKKPSYLEPPKELIWHA